MTGVSLLGWHEMDKLSLIYSNKQLTVAAVTIHWTGDEQLPICILLGGKVGGLL